MPSPPASTASRNLPLSMGTGSPYSLITSRSTSRSAMGKGRFIMDMAALNPQINYIGIERYSSVLLRALQKMELNPLPNLKFICMDATEVEDVFAPGEVARIYLNFSDPWPKDRHAKRRLTSRQFLPAMTTCLQKTGTSNSRPIIRIYLLFLWRKFRKPDGTWMLPQEICTTMLC